MTTMRAPVKCANCSNEFFPTYNEQRYCGRRCSNRHRNPPIPRPELVCPTCGEIFTSDRAVSRTKYCSPKCGRLSPNRSGPKTPWADRTLIDRAKVCAHCCNEFVTQLPRVQYCSSLCRTKAAKLRAAARTTRTRSSPASVAHGDVIAQRTALLVAQGGLCGLCSSEVKKPNWDHDHVTGAMRAILCDSCNLGLGLFKDNPELLRAAAVYIESYKEKQCAVS